MEVEGKVIGQCALFDFENMARSCELGSGIGEKEYWGKGYGSETIRLLLEWAFRYRNLREVWLTTMGSNERAIRCYLACGFVEEGRLCEHMWTDRRYVALVYMVVLRADWLADW